MLPGQQMSIKVAKAERPPPTKRDYPPGSPVANGQSTPGTKAFHPTTPPACEICKDLAPPMQSILLKGVISALCTGEPKAPRAESITWISPANSEPNSTEQLFYALRAAQHYAGRWEDLQKWAAQALKHAEDAEAKRWDWKPPKDFGESGEPIWAPTEAALEAERVAARRDADLEAIARMFGSNVVADLFASGVFAADARPAARRPSARRPPARRPSSAAALTPAAAHGRINTPAAARTDGHHGDE